MPTKEYNHILFLLEGSHQAGHPSIKRFRLKSALQEFEGSRHGR